MTWSQVNHLASSFSFSFSTNFKTGVKAGVTLYLHCISFPVNRVLRALMVFSVAPVEVELQDRVGGTQAASTHLQLVLRQVALNWAARRGAFFTAQDILGFFVCFFCVYVVGFFSF